MSYVTLTTGTTLAAGATYTSTAHVASQKNFLYYVLVSMANASTVKLQFSTNGGTTWLDGASTTIAASAGPTIVQLESAGTLNRVAITNTDGTSSTLIAAVSAYAA